MSNIIRFTNGDDGVFAHVVAPSGKHYGINLEHLACDADDEWNLAGKFFRAVVDKVRAENGPCDKLEEQAPVLQLDAIMQTNCEAAITELCQRLREADIVVQALLLKAGGEVTVSAGDCEKVLGHTVVSDVSDDRSSFTFRLVKAEPAPAVQ